MKSEIVIIYEPGQVEDVVSHFGRERLDKESLSIIALDYEIEFALRERNISYKSLHQYIDANKLNDIHDIALKLSREWFKTPEMKFFQHSNILLGGIKEPYFRSFFYMILYHLELFNNILDKYPDTEKLWIPQSGFVMPSAGPIAPFAYKVPVDVAILLGKINNFSVSVVPHSQQRFIKEKTRSVIRQITTNIFLLGLRLMNFVVTITRPPQKLKIFVIDHWRNIKFFTERMDNIELVMMVRKEVFKMGLWQVWKKRARFFHPQDLITSEIRKSARDKQRQLSYTWVAIGETPEFSKIFQYKEISFWSIVKPVLDALITEQARDIIQEIEGILRLLRYFSINRILLRASAKDQLYITAKLSQQLGIPSIELQHGVLDSESLVGFSPLKVDYFAAYGKLTKKMLTSDGNNPQRIIEVGSPRFDHYVARGKNRNNIEILRKRLNIDSSRPVILFVVPAIFIPIKQSLGFTTYEVVEMFQTMARVQEKMPGLQVILKFRPTSTREQFYRKAAMVFKEDMAIAQYEDIKTLVELSDVVVSPKSTVVLEAMIIGKPIVLYTLRKGASQFRLFERAGALLIAGTLEEISPHIVSLISNKEDCKRLVKNASNFLAEHYLFDGNSSDRIVRLLESPKEI